MARILISEPHDDVRRLLKRMVTRLGHEPILVWMAESEQLQSADVLMVEPAAPTGVVLAQAARIVNPTLPLICASIDAPPAELADLDVVFAAALLKPFTAQQLSDAISGVARPTPLPPQPSGVAGGATPNLRRGSVGIGLAMASISGDLIGDGGVLELSEHAEHCSIIRPAAEPYRTAPLQSTGSHPACRVLQRSASWRTLRDRQSMR
jgi:hypothetical protein